VPEPASPDQPGPRLDDYPNLQQLSSKLADNQSAEEFEESLDNLLNRLEDVLAHGIP